MKKQVFIDGNKRTAVIFSNHYLISKGKGIIAIPAELTEEFKDLLIPYYEEKDEKQKKSACSDAGRSSDAWMFPNYGRSCE